MSENYRHHELIDAIDWFYSKMEEIHSKRSELARQEIEIWMELQEIIHADKPEKLRELVKKHRAS